MHSFSYCLKYQIGYFALFFSNLHKVRSLANGTLNESSWMPRPAVLVPTLTTSFTYYFLVKFKKAGPCPRGASRIGKPQVLSPKQTVSGLEGSGETTQTGLQTGGPGLRPGTQAWYWLGFSSRGKWYFPSWPQPARSPSLPVLPTKRHSLTLPPLRNELCGPFP